MTLGPIDFLALEFPGNKFKGEILSEILQLVDAGLIRVLDLVVILKDSEGNVVVRELQELDPEDLRVLDPLKAEVNSMITQADIDDIAQALDNNCTAGLMLIENVWALKTMEAMIRADGRLLMFERIPHDTVEAALADIAEMTAAAE
jgi:uncharacterized membrane protein